MWVLPNYADTHCWDFYEKGKVLGKGAYGTTYLATRIGGTEKVAVKVT
jgi:serine/threonine protein kinase